MQEPKCTNCSINQTKITKHTYTTWKAVQLTEKPISNDWKPHSQTSMGVGQGTSHSKHQSQFGTVCAERNFIPKITKTNPIITETFSWTIRKHDDLIFIKNSMIQQYFHICKNSPKLYSEFIKPFWTNASTHKMANFLNIYKNWSKSLLIPETHNQNIQRKSPKNILKTKGNKAQLIIQWENHISKQRDYHNKPYIWKKAFITTTETSHNLFKLLFKHTKTCQDRHCNQTFVYISTHYMHQATKLVDATIVFLTKLAKKNKYP